MRPGVTGHAESAVWAGGPSAGSATKTPPTTGQRNEGWYPTYRPAPQVANYLLNELSQRAKGVASMRLLNWIETDVAAIADTGGPIDGIHDPITGSEVIVDFTGVAAFEDNTAPGGMVWAAGAGGAGMSGVQPRLAVDQAGNVAFVNSQACPPAALAVAYSPTPLGGWVAWPGGGAPAGTWCLIEHDWLGRWVISGTLGTMLTSTAPAVAFGALATAPGWIAATIVGLKHSHHPAAKVWPADPGNQHWVALTPTQRSTSLDGTNWTAAAAHGLGGIPWDLAYSAFGAKWICPVFNAGVLIGMGVSTDNGATWALGAAPATALAGPLTQGRIACDGFGDWMMALGDGAAVELWASWDNGGTWHEAYPPTTPIPNNFALWYGGGRFHLMCNDAGANWTGYASLRADE